MTSDPAAKKAARPRMVATGEDDDSARRAVGRYNPSPDEVTGPPAIDPREYAVYSHRWGMNACYLVRYQDHYYAWITDPRNRSRVYRMDDEEMGRHFVDNWQAANFLSIGWPERIINLFLLDPADTTRILYEATVVNVMDSGIWLARYDDTDNDDPWLLASFKDLGAALSQFATQTEHTADRVERSRPRSSPDLIAAVLRYRAAMARSQAAGAALGDAARRHQVADISHPLSSAVQQAGVSPGALPAVLAAQELAWPQGAVVRAPGSRLPETPVRVLATHTVNGQHFSLVSYQDSSGRRCVAIDRDDRHSSSLCDVPVTDQDLVQAGMTMATRGRGIAAVYGRAHDSVTRIYAIMKDGQQVDWPIYDDPDAQQRYFTVIADSDALADIIATAPGKQVSLKRFFGTWFSKAPTLR